MGYHRAGFDVVGVDLEPQPDYPFEFHRGDALDFLREHGHEFDAIAASPPCQASTALTKGNRKRAGWSDSHEDLIPSTRFLLECTGKLFVIENVQGSSLRRDLTLCGLMFGLRVFRHRYFELGGWSMPNLAHPSHAGHRVAGWRHGVKYEGDMVAVYGDGGGKGSVADWQAAMGIDWTSSKAHLAEAIPPLYTQLIGTHLLEHLDSTEERAA
jgi:DNA (cytosine-5)-methyltransferase 1